MTAVGLSRRPPAERGVTSIAPGVVEKIVDRVVAEVDGVSGVQRAGLRPPVIGRRRAARVQAQVDGSLVTLRMTLAVEWPTSVRDAAQRVRDHVGQRVRVLTGLDVVAVDIRFRAML